MVVGRLKRKATRRRRSADWDLLVAGGGIAGAATAALAQQAGLRTVLVDGNAPDQPAEGAPIDLRVSTLSLGSERTLRALEAWGRLDPSRVCPFQAMRVWEQGGGALEFGAHEAGQSTLGVVVENRAVRSALWQACDALGVELLVPNQVTEADLDDNGCRVALDDGQKIRARLVVGADGARSQLRNMADIGVQEDDYGQRGVVAVFDTDGGHSGTAWQRFMPDGPLALLPLPGGQCSIVWSTHHADQLLSLSELEFSQRATDASEGVCGQLSLASERAAFPLRYLQAERYIGPGVALVGDAAHVVHPLAGQGANLGLADAAALIEVVSHDEERVGDVTTLRRYERWRRSENVITGRFLDALQRLFSMEGAASLRVRKFGLDWVNALSPAKELFSVLASGTGPGAPKICRANDDIHA